MPEPERGCLVATGPDRVSWLNGIVSADVAKVVPGSGQWALALTKTGKITSELAIIAGSDALYVATSPGTAAELFQAFDRMLVMEDAELFDRSNELAFVFVHGARALELTRDVAARSGASYGAIDWTGLGGAALVVERARLSEAAQALTEDSRATLATPEQWEELRIACGVPRFGVDYDSKDNPHEASLEQRAVSWTKGCYLGQEVVCMQDMRGKVKRRIVRLDVSGTDPFARGASVHSEGQEVGELTSVAVGQSGVLALARIRTPFDEPGKPLSVDGRAATVQPAGV